MLVSVVIPMYNASKYIEECINSILNQTYKNFEIIVVNDGSTDNSLQVIRKFNDKIKIVNKKNGGTASALNAGIKVMNGSWFKWLSADDKLKNNALEVLIAETKKLGEESKNCILYSYFDIIDENSNFVKTIKTPNYNHLSYFDRGVILLDDFYGNGSGSLIHKSIFERAGLFDEIIDFQEDYEFWLRCCILHNCTLYLIPEILAQYRVHSKQLTSLKRKDGYKNENLIKNTILKQLDPNKRALYQKTLKKFQNKIPIKARIKRKIKLFIITQLPEFFSFKLLNLYRVLTKN